MIELFPKEQSLHFDKTRPTLELVILASLIPGLGLAWSGRRRLAAAALLLTLMALLVLVWMPSLPGLVGLAVVYIAQMLVSAGLNAWDEPLQPEEGSSLVILPGDLANLTQAGAAAILRRFPIGSGLETQTVMAWLAGYDANLRQVQMLAVTPTSLVLVRCASDGSPIAAETIMQPKIFWITLEIWQHHCLLMIEFNGSQRPPIILRLPRKTEWPTRRFFEFFSGNLEYKVPISEAIEPARPVSVRPSDLLLSLVALGLVAFGALRSTTGIDPLSLWSMAAGCFVIPWPRLIWTLRLLRTGTEPRVVAYLAAILTGLLSLVGWGMACMLLSLVLKI